MDNSQLTLRPPPKTPEPVTPEPVTPKKQLGSPLLNADDHLRAFYRLGCTPETKKEIQSRKRKADQVADEGVPATIPLYLKWRLALVQSALDVNFMKKQAITEVSEPVDEAGTSMSELMATLKAEEKVLLSEKTLLLSQRKTLNEDLSDVITSLAQLEDAYINELRMAAQDASSSKDKLTGLKAPRLSRGSFGDLIHDYLGTKDAGENPPEQKFCNIMGYWLPGPYVRCAHIVPYSWSNKDMAHMLCSDELPLTSRRNGLSLHKLLEAAFDNCWIAIVPDGSITPIPTEWKCVVLHSEISKDVFFEDKSNVTDRRLWRYEDIDGRKLTFLNGNRPARRFLYLRYALAWMHAQDKSWPDFKEKLPPGEIWASPNKPDGYLRKSILVAIGQRIGDTLPQDLVNAGVFEDPATSSPVHDEVAAIRVTEHLQKYLDGERDPKITDETTDQSEDEHADPDEEATTG